MLLAACFCQQAATMSAYKFTPCAVASPDAPQKPLVRKRVRSGGADWVRVTGERSPSKAKRPRTAGSQQPACTHKEHQIRTTAEAASFASQFWDRKLHPTKASQHKFLATCIDVDSEKNVQHAQRQWSLPLWKGATMRRIRIQSNQRSLEHWTKSSQNPGKVPKPTVLAHTECPREI